MERTNAALNLPARTVDQLPKDRGNRQITLSDTAFAIGWLVLVILFVPLQHFHSFLTASSGDNLAILNPALWTFWLPFLIAVLLSAVRLEIAKYRAGRWTWWLVALNALLDLAFAAPLVWLLLTDQLLNPEFVARFEWLGRGNNLDKVATVSALGVILIVLWDIVDSLVKAHRNRR